MKLEFAVLTAFVAAAIGAAPALAQSPGQAFRDCAECPEMVVIPAGAFVMGSQAVPAVNFSAPGDEQPLHQVALKSFAIGKYEVTQAQWSALMGGNPSANIGPTLPVDKVSWEDIQLYIQKLNARTGKRYRLPSESEWEYAARAGSTTLWSFGDGEAQLGNYAWSSANAGGRSHPVGQKSPNGFGLYDMHGNVWEWVQDCHRENYNRAPTDGSAYEREGLCPRVLRGGSWTFPAWHQRSAYRSAYLPGLRGFDVGFRLALSLQ